MMQNSSSAPLRQQAIHFLQSGDVTKRPQEPQLRPQKINPKKGDTSLFQPYNLERSALGGLIGSKGDGPIPEARYYLPLHRLKISLVVKPSNESTLIRRKNILFFAKGKPRRCSKVMEASVIQQYLKVDSKDIEYNFAKLVEDVPKEEFMDRYLKQKGKRLQSLCGGLVSPIHNKWKVSVTEEKDKMSPKRDKFSKLVSKRTQIYPGIGQYSPEWEKIHPRSTTNVYITKTDRNSITKTDRNSIISKSVRKLPQQVPSMENLKTDQSNESGYLQMYATLLSQVSREVNLSLKVSPQSQHPYKNLSVKPLNQNFIEDGKILLDAKLAETKKMRLKITSELHRMISSDQ